MTETVVRVPSFSAHCVTFKFSVGSIIVLPTILDCIFHLDSLALVLGPVIGLELPHCKNFPTFKLVGSFTYLQLSFKKKNVNKRYTLTCKVVFYIVIRI